MTTTLTTRPGQGLTATVYADRPLEGYTVSIEFADKGDYSSVDLTKTPTVSGRNVSFTLNSTEVNAIGYSRFRVLATKGGFTRTVETGFIQQLESPAPQSTQPTVTVPGVAADGSTNDTAALQAAIDALPATGGLLQLPAGKVKVTSLVIPASKRVTLAGAGTNLTNLVGDSTTAGYSSGVIVCKGSVAGSIALSSDATVYSTSINVSSASGLAAGDWILVGSTAPHASNTNISVGNASQPRGEQVQIASITGNTLTLVAPLRDTYTTAATGFVQKINFAEGLELRDMTVSHGDNAKAANITSQLVYCQYARNIALENVTMRDGIGAGLHLDSCRNVSVLNCVVVDLPGGGAASNAPGGTARYGYGIDLKASTEDVLIDGLRASKVRHAVTVDGLAGRSGVVRRVVISNGIATQCKGTAWDTHVNGDDIVFQNCSVSGTDYSFEASTPNGFLIRSRNTKIIDANIERVSVGIEIWGDAHRCQIIGGSIRRLIAIGPNVVKGIGISITGSNDAANPLSAAERVLIKNVTIEASDNELIKIAGNANGLQIVNNRLANGNMANNASGVGASSAISFLAGLTISNFLIRGNDIGNDPAYSAGTVLDPGASGNMQRAVYFAGTSTFTGGMIADNTYENLLGVMTNVQPWGGTVQAGVTWRGNRRPARTKVIGSATVGASPYTYQAGDSPEIVHIFGGTVTLVAKSINGTSGTFVQVNNASPAMVFLEAKEAVQITYSVAPTVRFDYL